jgi:hypothetical protein
MTQIDFIKVKKGLFFFENRALVCEKGLNGATAPQYKEDATRKHKEN